MSTVNRSLTLLALAAAGVALGSLAFERGFSPLEKAWGIRLETAFNALPESGHVAENALPWAGNTWDRDHAGIADRWIRRVHAADKGGDALTENEPRAYEAGFVTLAELRQLDPAARRRRIRALSPAEKFDLYRGRLDFPLAREEEKRNHIDPHAEVALSRGWSLSATAVSDSPLLRPLASLTRFLFPTAAAASLSLHEPAPVTRTVRLAPDFEVEVPFGASDVKALIAYYVGVRAPGRGYSAPAHTLGSADSELSAEAFHVVLANTVGRAGRPLTFSFWEQGTERFAPIVRFESSLRHDETTAGRNRYLVTTDFWAVAPAPKRWKALRRIESEASSERGLADEESGLRHFQAVYRIDEDGKSEWLDGVRPATLARANPTELAGDFEKLGELYEASPEMKD